MADSTIASPELISLIAQLADNKCILGQRYAEWCTAAPTLESAVAAASMAQDEIGHARSFYPVLRDVAGESPESEPETRTQWLNSPFLNAAFAGWTDFVAANFLFDTALTTVLEGCTESTFSPLAQRARRILQEEPLHWLHGEGWVRRLAREPEGVRDALQHSLDAIARETDVWFDVAHPSLVETGVIALPSDALRQTYWDNIRPVLQSSGLAGSPV